MLKIVIIIITVIFCIQLAWATESSAYMRNGLSLDFAAYRGNELFGQVKNESGIPNIVGKKVEFNGIDQSIYFNDTYGTNDHVFTIYLCFKSSATDAFDVIFSSGRIDSAFGYFSITVDSGSNLRIVITDDTGDSLLDYWSQVNILDGEINIIALTFNNGSINIYKNGEFKKNKTYTPDTISAQITTIASWKRDTEKNYFSADLYHLLIYGERAHDEQEIRHNTEVLKRWYQAENR